MYPDNPGEVLALLVVVQGDNGGVFVYNAAGQLVDSMAALANVDPNTSSNLAGIENVNPANGTFVQLNNGQVIVGLNGASVLNAQVISAAAAQIATAVGAALALICNGSLMQLISPQVQVAASGGGPTTGALLEVDGTLTATAQISTTALANIVANGGLIAQLGDVIAQAGNLIANTIGKGLQIATGTNGRLIKATLAGGTVTVANTSVTANTQIFVNHVSIGPNAGVLGYVLNPGVGFTINSTNAADANSVSCLLVERL